MSKRSTKARRSLRYGATKQHEKPATESAANAGEETAAMRLLQEDIRTMPSERLKAYWKKWVMLAALSIGQSGS